MKNIIGRKYKVEHISYATNLSLNDSCRGIVGKKLTIVTEPFSQTVRPIGLGTVTHDFIIVKDDDNTSYSVLFYKRNLEYPKYRCSSFMKSYSVYDYIKEDAWIDFVESDSYNKNCEYLIHEEFLSDGTRHFIIYKI